MSFGNRLTSYSRLNLPDLNPFHFLRSPDALSGLSAPDVPNSGSSAERAKVNQGIERPKKVIGRADLFTKYSDEKFLEGGNCRTALCVAGFSATHYPVSEIGYVLNKKFDAWVARINEQSARLGNPIGIFYSAASLAAIQVERMNPGRFKGLIFIGTPLKLASAVHQLAMVSCDAIRNYTKDRFPTVANYINEKTFKIPTTYEGVSKLVRKNAIYEDSSGAAFLELYKGQQLAYSGLKEIGCKILYLQGKYDEFVSPKVPDLFKRLYPRELLTVHKIDGSHGPQLEGDRAKMFSIMSNWIRSELPS